MMRPPPRMCGSAAWMHFSGPMVLTSKTWRRSSARSSATRPESPSPALLTRTSMEPNASTVSLTIASTEPASEMSVFTVSARPPEAEISRRSDSSLPSSREASTTAVPRDACSRAVNLCDSLRFSSQRRLCALVATNLRPSVRVCRSLVQRERRTGARILPSRTVRTSSVAKYKSERSPLRCRSRRRDRRPSQRVIPGVAPASRPCSSIELGKKDENAEVRSRVAVYHVRHVAIYRKEQCMRSKLAILLAVGALMLALTAGAAWGANLACQIGIACNGTAKSDVMTGTNQSDQIKGFGGQGQDQRQQWERHRHHRRGRQERHHRRQGR